MKPLHRFRELRTSSIRFKHRRQGKLAIDSIGGTDGGLLKLQEALGLTAKAGDDAGRTITESFGRVDSAVKTAAEGVNALRASFIDAAEAAKAINVAASNMGGGGGGSGPHGPGSGMGIPGGAQLPRRLAWLPS
jgi:hypothetical protein